MLKTKLLGMDYSEIDEALVGKHAIEIAANKQRRAIDREKNNTPWKKISSFFKSSPMIYRR